MSGLVGTGLRAIGILVILQSSRLQVAGWYGLMDIGKVVYGSVGIGVAGTLMGKYGYMDTVRLMGAGLKEVGINHQDPIESKSS